MRALPRRCSSHSPRFPYHLGLDRIERLVEPSAVELVAVGAKPKPPVFSALLAVVEHYARDGREEVIIYGLTWLLLLSGVRVAMAHGADAGDAANLSRTTYIPRSIWALLWLAGTVLAVVIGGKWLVLQS